MTTIYVTSSKELPMRRPYEFYPTERTLIRAVLDKYRPESKLFTILDPGAGDGRWGQIARDYYPSAWIDGIEIRDVPRPDGFNVWHTGDFLKFTQFTEKYLYDLIVSNPPYGPKSGGVTLAERFVRHSWDLLAPGGTMLFLLRLAFQAGVDRCNGLWTTHPLYKLVVLSRRPSFYNRGTNGTDYAVYIWRKGSDGQPVGQPGQWPAELLNYERE